MQTWFPTHSRLLAQTHGIETEIESPQSFAKSRKCKEMEDANQAVSKQSLGSVGAHKPEIL